eukprot:s5137_g2.t1
MACAIIRIASACCEPKGRCHQMSSLWPGIEIIPLVPELLQRILRELFPFDYNTSTRCGVLSRVTHRITSAFSDV